MKEITQRPDELFHSSAETDGIPYRVLVPLVLIKHERKNDRNVYSNLHYYIFVKKEMITKKKK